MSTPDLLSALRDAAKFLRDCRETEPAEYFEAHARTCERVVDLLTALRALRDDLAEAVETKPAPRGMCAACGTDHDNEARLNRAALVGIKRRLDTLLQEATRQSEQKDDTRVDGESCKRGTGSTAPSLKLTPAQERDVLGFDPWGERDATYRVLRSGFAVCRKPHTCAICFGKISAGDRIWARAETDDGRTKTFHFCAECCWCIAHRYDESDDDPNYGFDRMYERWEVGRRRAESQQAADAVARSGPNHHEPPTRA